MDFESPNNLDLFIWFLIKFGISNVDLCHRKDIPGERLLCENCIFTFCNCFFFFPPRYQARNRSSILSHLLRTNKWTQKRHDPIEVQYLTLVYKNHKLAYGQSGPQTLPHKSSNRACRRCSWPISMMALHWEREWLAWRPQNSSVPPAWWWQSTSCLSSGRLGKQREKQKKIHMTECPYDSNIDGNLCRRFTFNTAVKGYIHR